MTLADSSVRTSARTGTGAFENARLRRTSRSDVGQQDSQSDVASDDDAVSADSPMMEETHQSAKVRAAALISQMFMRLYFSLFLRV